MRRLLLTWQEPDRDPFVETFNEGESGSFPVGHADPIEWGKRTLDRFNDTLRPNELPRHFISGDVVELDARESKAIDVAHDWTKTNLVTVTGRGGVMYDTARCRVCGITGKRFGVGNVTRDPEFRPAGFATCNGAQKLLKRRQNKRA